MTSSGDLRDRLGSVALLAAPVVALAASVIHPPETTNASRQLAITAGSLNRWYLAHLLYLVAFALFVPAVLALGRRLRGAGPALELWGTGLAIAGLFSSAGIVALEGFGGWQLAQSPDRAAAADTLNRITHSAGVAIPLGVLGLTFSAGLVVLAIGLLRNRAAATWVAVGLIVGAVLLAAGLAAAVKPALMAGLACLAAAMVATGLADFTTGRAVPAQPFRQPSGAPAPASR